MQCAKCNGEMEYKEGISKRTNQPYKMWKCKPCDYVQFINDTPKPAKQDNTLKDIRHAIGVLQDQVQEIYNLLTDGKDKAGNELPF